jgi:Domain of unknown function (DUF6046)
MSLQFYIPQPASKVTEKTLIKGFGLPLVQRALIGNIDPPPIDPHEKSKFGITKFGTPVFDSLYIKAPEWYEFTYNEQTKVYKQNENPESVGNNSQKNDSQGLFIEGVIIEANLSRNVVTTQVSGYNGGSIKEFISNGDWNITIRGFVSSNYADIYPEEDTRLLQLYSKAPVTLEVTSRFLNSYLDINNIVVTGLNLFQQQGLRNIQYFEMTCLSDIPYTIPNNAKTA